MTKISKEKTETIHYSAKIEDEHVLDYLWLDVDIYFRNGNRYIELPDFNLDSQKEVDIFIEMLEQAKKHLPKDVPKEIELLKESENLY